MKRASYQGGSIRLKPRKRGPDVWELRYMKDGRQVPQRIGTTAQYRTEAAARKAILPFLEEINDLVSGVSIAGLCKSYAEDEGLDIRENTKSTNLSFLKRIQADLGKKRIAEVANDIPAVENWLNGLQTYGRPEIVRPAYIAKGKLVTEKRKPAVPPQPLAKASKLHMKAFLRLLFEYAMKHGKYPVRRNPIELVKIKGAPVKVRVHTLLTAEQYAALMGIELPEHVRTMIQIAMLLGLRISEILGLKWEAIDFAKKTIWVQVSSVGKHSADTKTKASFAELPMHEDLEAVLEAWKKSNTGPDGSSMAVNGWLFGNITTGRPLWAGALQKKYLIPAGKRIGIQSLGWHDFRHTYRAMMGELDIPLELQQKLMRHSDIAMTMKYGGQRSLDKLREAQAKVVQMQRQKFG